jgi:hypothetical protein
MNGLAKGWIALVAVAALAAPRVWAQIDGSKHDFVNGTSNYNFWNPTTQKYGLCSSCHTAHSALSTDAPLWNHTLTTQTFTLYSSSTLDNTISQPSGVSKACLSCHDGVTAINSVGGSLIGNNGNPLIMTGDAVIGTDLSNDHPVSIVYDNTVDTGLRSPSEVATAGLRLYGTGTKTVECGSCHDPHKPGIAGLFFRPYTGYDTNCLVCHNK